MLYAGMSYGQMELRIETICIICLDLRECQTWTS